MTRPPPNAERRRPARAILLLGAAVRPDGHASPTLARRTGWAARLWHAGAGCAIVACGGTGRHPPSEAEVMRRLLIEDGVPRDVIHPERRSTSTAENIAFARPILEDLRLGAVLIVSDAYHLPRAALIARRAGLDVLTAHPPWQDASTAAQVKGALREGPAFIAAWLKLRAADRRR
jgi:uncharacterized SAM-binding protein YcdF (DUF218 family)